MRFDWGHIFPRRVRRWQDDVVQLHIMGLLMISDLEMAAIITQMLILKQLIQLHAKCCMGTETDNAKGGVQTHQQDWHIWTT
jgi:hypothetical protein